MMENVSVFVGELADPKAVKAESGEHHEVKFWQYRAMWSYLRLVYGRRIDDEIKRATDREHRKQIMHRLLAEAQQTRPLQFIIRDGGVVAVATTKHLLIPPEQVYATAEQIIEQHLEKVEGMSGYAIPVKELDAFNVGIQIDAGTITTRKCVTVSSYAIIRDCLNPLSWLGSGNLHRFGLHVRAGGFEREITPSRLERILRIKKVSDLKPRLTQAISGAKSVIKDMEALIERSKKEPVDPQEAKIVLGAFSAAYNVGLKTIKEILERFDKEDKTRYGMAQAASWVARHSDVFRKTPEGKESRARQNVSTVGASTMLINDMHVTAEQCKKWLKDQKSKLAEKLLKGELP